jgi:hypothetical protein
MGQRADGRSDVFSVGVMLYEMLTGTAPFSGETITSLMFQVLNVNPAPPRQLVSLIPEMLNFVVAKALAKKADDRYQSAMDLANDLRECARQLAQAQSGSQPLPVVPPAGTAPPPRADEKTEIVDSARLASRTRFDDTQQMGEEPPPARGVSKTFDSYAATMKVASRTGMTAALDEFAKTQLVARTGSHAAIEPPAPASAAVTQPVPVVEPTTDAGSAAERSGKHAARAVSPVAELLQKVKAHEEAALIAGVVAALIIAALIVFV